MRGADRAEGVRRRSGERGHQARGRRPEGQPAGHPAGEDQAQRGRQTADQHQPPQPGEIAGGAVEQYVPPGRRGHGGRGEGDRRPGLLALLPQQPGAHADDGRHVGREGHRVVLVEDARHVAEDHHRDQQRAAPHQERGPGDRRPPQLPGGHQARGQQDQRGRQQPGDLAADLGVEHPVPAGRAPAPRAASASAAADAAGLVTADAAEAVVAEGQLKEAVVLRTADVGAGGGRPQLDDRHPPAAGDDQRDGRQPQLGQPPAQPHRTADGVDERQRRQDQERLQGLGEERETDRGPGPHEPPGPAVLHGPHDEVAGQRHQQGQHRVRVVEPEHQRGDRGEREHRTRDQTRPRAEPAPDGRVHDRHRAGAHEDFGREDRPGVQAEDPHRQLHRPQEGRGLVDGDGVARVQRAEEERLPGPAARLHGRRVEGVGVTGGAEVVQVEQEGGGQQAEEGRARPARVLGPAAPQSAREGPPGLAGPSGGRGSGR